MAKGKSKGPSYTSKGERPNVASRTLNDIRKSFGGAAKVMNQQKAWLLGQNPWMTIDNPNPNERNKKRIRVRANTYLGNPFAKKNDLSSQPA